MLELVAGAPPLASDLVLESATAATTGGRRVVRADLALELATTAAAHLAADLLELGRRDDRQRGRRL